MYITLDESFLFGVTKQKSPSFIDFQFLTINEISLISSFIQDFNEAITYPNKITFCGKNKTSINTKKPINSLQNSIVTTYNIYHYHLSGHFDKCKYLSKKDCSLNNFINKTKNNCSNTSDDIIHYTQDIFSNNINIFAFSKDHDPFPQYKVIEKRLQSSKCNDPLLFLLFYYFFKFIKKKYSSNIIFNNNLYCNFLLAYKQIAPYLNFSNFFINSISIFNSTTYNFDDLYDTLYVLVFQDFLFNNLNNQSIDFYIQRAINDLI